VKKCNRHAKNATGKNENATSKIKNATGAVSAGINVKLYQYQRH
jgi:hypothetical protein